MRRPLKRPGWPFSSRTVETFRPLASLLSERWCIMMEGLLQTRNAIYEILIRDADGRHLELESFRDLDTARRRLPAIAAQYPGTKITLWDRNSRTILAESDGY